MKFVRLTVAAMICAWGLVSSAPAQQTNQRSSLPQTSGAESRRSSRPFLGIYLGETDGGGGVTVQQLVAKGPADQAGMQKGDVITELDEQAISEIASLIAVVQRRQVGDVVALRIRRNENELILKLALADRDEFTPQTRRVEQPPRDRKPTKDTKTFSSGDGLAITADVYSKIEDKETPLIVLCHQAGWSRGEYLEIAPKLNELGFNCLAIDQRSGGAVNDVPNETVIRAKAEKKPTTFLDAEQDMIAAVRWARENIASGKVILWGSSYSASLALRIAGEHPELVDGVLAFAPGEYFERMGKPKDWVTTSAKKIRVPAFITSAKKEVPRWQGIFDAISNEGKAKFVPSTEGNHGSRALWAQFDDSPEYWKSVNQFLAQFL